MLGHCSCRGTDLQLPDLRMTGSCSDINEYTTFVQEQGRDQFGGKTHVSEQDTAAVQHSVAFTKSRHLARRGCRHGCADPAPASPGSRQNAASLPSPTSRPAPPARRADPSTKAGECDAALRVVKTRPGESSPASACRNGVRSCKTTCRNACRNGVRSCKTTSSL